MLGRLDKDTVQPDAKLIGLIIGLCIYNQALLDVNLPELLFKAMLGKPVKFPTIQDLALIDPALAKGLSDMLAYEQDDFEDVYGWQDFTVAYKDAQGVHQTVELFPNGANKQLTKENRLEFVKLRVKYALVDSIDVLMEGLLVGFHSIIRKDSSVLKMFQPLELELMLVGERRLDFATLKMESSYEGGYSEHTPIVAQFWDYALHLSLEKQGQLMQFITGSYRSPVGGHTFKIQRAGPDADALPTSHTCFNTLLLPEYSSNERLVKYMDIAISHSSGFGLE